MKRKVKRNAASDEILLNDAFEEFIDRKTAQGLSKATIENYRTTFAVFWNYNEFDKDTTTCEVMTEQSFYKWTSHMMKEELSASSIQHYQRDWRAIAYWMMDMDYIVEPFKIKITKSQEEIPKSFSDEEIELLLEKPRRTEGFVEWRTWAIINFVLATGARANTICSLKVSDINFAKREILYAETKNKKAQIVPMSGALETCLKEYVRMWRQVVDGFLFPNVGEEKMTTNALYLSFKRYAIKRDVNKYNIHGLRHSFAERWIQNNGNTIALQKIMGHSSTEMTKRYVRLYGTAIAPNYDDYSPLDTIKRSKSRKNKINKSEL